MSDVYRLISNIISENIVILIVNSKILTRFSKAKQQVIHERQYSAVAL